MKNCPAQFIPTLEQLQQFRRTGSVSKSDVMKSAGKLVAVHNPRTGQLLGFGTAERIDVTKSGDESNGLGGGTGNDIFDDLFEFSPDFQSSGVEIEKSAELADDPNAELAAIFPTWLQPN